MRGVLAGVALAAGLAAMVPAKTPSTINLLALHGLAGFSALENSDNGRLALRTNYEITKLIQAGQIGQPGLTDFPAQRRQALRDAAVTFSNGRQLADGLGSTLGAAYNQLTDYPAAKADCKPETNVGKAVAASLDQLFLYTATLTGGDGASAKLFFAQGPAQGPAPDATPGPGGAAAAGAASSPIFTDVHGRPNVFGDAYDLAPGSKPDKYGDPRPFQTMQVQAFTGTDYFGATRNSTDYLTGPVQCLTDSPSFPSGHTTYGYTESLLFALMIPERYSQMIARAAEFGNGRILMGAHYAMDVIAGRSLAYYDVAHLLAGNQLYLDQKLGRTAPVTDYLAALGAARDDLRKALARQCKNTIAACAAADTGRFNNAAADKAFVRATLTYGLGAVYPERVNQPEDVAAVAPEAGYLLTTAFPKLSLIAADDILTATEAPGGGFLDNGSALGVYSRLNLYEAALQAAR